MSDSANENSKVIFLEGGKPFVESRGETVCAASFLEWFAGEAKQLYVRVSPSSFPYKRIMVIECPVGVTAAIAPWTFPAAMITRKLGLLL